MAEREAQIFKLPEQGAEESIDVRRLPHLISGAGASTGSDRSAIALEINKTLIRMREHGHEEAESQILMLALDQRRFHGLVDTEGRSCRKEAVETLLACGFPHALNVSPEDLDYARRWTPSPVEDEAEPVNPVLRAKRTKGLGVIVISQVVFTLATWMMVVDGSGPVLTAARVSGFLAVLVSMLFVRSKPHVENEAGWGAALGILALIQGICAMDVGVPALLGAVGLAIGLLASLSGYEARADPPKPGDWDYTNKG